MVALAEKIDEIHHADDFVLREFAVESKRIGGPVLVCYLDFDFLPQVKRMVCRAS